MTTLARNHVDLHCHTRRSDGVLEPRDLYAAMRARGLRLAAITDHDTLDGYRELRAAGQGAAPSASGPQLIPALEINTVGQVGMTAHGLGRTDGELHVLGFGVDIDDTALDATLARQRGGRQARIDLTLAVLRDQGVPVDDEFASLGLSAATSRGRPHVGEALVLAGHATSVQDAFERWLAAGRPAYVPRQGIGPREAIDAIRGAGGLAVLAHSPTAPDHVEDVERLRGWGLEGIEVYYRTFDAATVERLAQFAARAGLLATGGSDFHGQDMTYPDVAACTRVPDAVGEALLRALGTPR
jgi:3',5'-nucleoside bisphosphate phosphatase